MIALAALLAQLEAASGHLLLVTFNYPASPGTVMSAGFHMCGSFYEETLARLGEYQPDTVEVNYLGEEEGADAYAELVFTVDNAEAHADRLTDLTGRVAAYFDIVATPRIVADDGSLVIGFNAAKALPFDTSDEFYQAVKDAVAAGNEQCEQSGYDDQSLIVSFNLGTNALETWESEEPAGLHILEGFSLIADSNMDKDVLVAILERLQDAEILPDTIPPSVLGLKVASAMYSQLGEGDVQSMMDHPTFDILT